MVHMGSALHHLTLPLCSYQLEFISTERVNFYTQMQNCFKYG